MPEDRPQSGPPETLRLLLAGDAMLGRGVNEVIHRVGPDVPLELLVEITRPADLFFVNLECAISAHDRIFSGAPKAFYFRADPIAAETLTGAGVDLVCLANNHALDADYQGLRDTLRILDSKHIAHTGAGLDLEEARRPAILEARGMRLGVLGCCDHQSDFAARPDRPGVRYVDLEAPRTADVLADEVRSLAERADHVIVAFHWQPNWAPRVSEAYRRLAGRLVGAGASVIWGHSPHHFQGVEWIDGDAALYATGDLVDDYALDVQFRNDRQLLFEVVLGREAVQRVRAYPIELAYARSHPARGEARRWIERRFGQMCRQVGSRLVRDGDWLEVLPE